MKGLVPKTTPRLSDSPARLTEFIWCFPSFKFIQIPSSKFRIYRVNIKAVRKSKLEVKRDEGLEKWKEGEGFCCSGRIQSKIREEKKFKEQGLEETGARI